MNRHLFLRLMILSAISAPFVVPGAETALIRVLVLDGFSNHDWRHTTRRIRGILDAAGGFDTCPS